MSSWIEGVHTIELLQDVSLDIYDSTAMILTTKDKLDYYNDCLKDLNVFRYLCLDRNNEHILKNCFITKITEYENDISIMNYLMSKEESN